jgi:hypothetical protein
MKTLAFCVVVLGLLGLRSAYADEKLEPVNVVSLVRPKSGDGPVKIKLRASSGGCTKADHFKLEVTKAPNGTHLRVIRLKKDACEMYAPNGTEVEITTKDVPTGSPIFVDNPLFVGNES